MADRTPLLADRFLYTRIEDNVLRPRVLDAVRTRLRQARRFVLSDEAAVRLAEVIRDVPELLLRDQQFARAPFDVCWFEFPYPAFFETLSGTATTDEGDYALGYLVDHGTVYVVPGGTVSDPSARPVLLPLAYHLHDPWEIDEQIAFCSRTKTSRMQLDPFFWGKTFLQLSQDEQRALRDAHSCSLLLRDGVDASRMFDMLVRSSSGDLRNVVALLLLMNRPSLTRYVQEVGPRKHFYRGKQRTFLSHTVVTIEADPVPTLRLVGTPDGEPIPRRRHEVRGHFCHDQKSRGGSRTGCVHAWEDDPAYPADDCDHWVCTGCGGRRWWRRKHERGDATIGFNTKHYSITAEPTE